MYYKYSPVIKIQTVQMYKEGKPQISFLPSSHPQLNLPADATTVHTLVSVCPVTQTHQHTYMESLGGYFLHKWDCAKHVFLHLAFLSLTIHLGKLSMQVHRDLPHSFGTV